MNLISPASVTKQLLINNLFFSLLQPARLLTLEQWCGPAGEVNINTCVYECIRSRVHRQSLTTVTLTSKLLLIWS